MSYQYRFCPTCATQRTAYNYRCSVCGGAVRHTDRSVAVASPADPGQQRPFSTEWHRLTVEDAQHAARRASAA